MATIRYKEMIIPLASGWKDGTQVVAIKLLDDYRPNMVVSCEPVSDTDSAERYAKRSLPSLRKALPAMVLEEEGPVMLGPWNGYGIVYRFDASGTTLKQIQWYVKKADKMYTFTATDIVGRFDTTRMDAEQMFSQFRTV